MSIVSICSIADANAPMRGTPRSMLLGCGFSDIHEVHNGATALQKIEEKKFDFLITDTALPGLGSFQLLKAVRSDPQLHPLPVPIVQRN